MSYHITSLGAEDNPDAAAYDAFIKEAAKRNYGTSDDDLRAYAKTAGAAGASAGCAAAGAAVAAPLCAYAGGVIGGEVYDAVKTVLGGGRNPAVSALVKQMYSVYDAAIAEIRRATGSSAAEAESRIAEAHVAPYYGSGTVPLTRQRFRDLIDIIQEKKVGGDARQRGVNLLRKYRDAAIMVGAYWAGISREDYAQQEAKSNSPPSPPEAPGYQQDQAEARAKHNALQKEAEAAEKRISESNASTGKLLLAGGGLLLLGAGYLAMRKKR